MKKGACSKNEIKIILKQSYEIMGRFISGADKLQKKKKNTKNEIAPLFSRKMCAPSTVTQGFWQTKFPHPKIEVYIIWL